MKRTRIFSHRRIAWLAALTLTATSLPAAPFSVYAEEGEPAEETTAAPPAEDGPEVLVITGFPQFAKDGAGNFTDSAIQEKYGSLSAEIGTAQTGLGLPKDLSVSAYYEADGPDVIYDPLELKDMVWKLKDDTTYSEASPAGSYVFIPDFNAYLETSDVAEEIRLADGVKAPELTVSITDPSQTEAAPESEPEAAELPTEGIPEVPDVTDELTGDGSETFPETDMLTGDGSETFPETDMLTGDGSVDNIIYNTDDSLLGLDGNADVEIYGETQSFDEPETQFTEEPETQAPETQFMEEPETQSAETLPETEMMPETETEPVMESELWITPDPLGAPESETLSSETASSAESESETSSGGTEVPDVPEVAAAPDLSITFALSDGTTLVPYMNAQTGSSVLLLKGTPAEGENSAQMTLPCSSTLNIQALLITFTDPNTGLVFASAPGGSPQDFTDGLATKNYEISNTVTAEDGTMTTYTYPFSLTVTKQAHVWGGEATCTTAQTCTVCGAIGTAALGHDWKAATCTAPKTCSRCGATDGAALGHAWEEATCTDPKICSRCGAESGKPLGHLLYDDWEVEEGSSYSPSANNPSGSSYAEHGTEIRYCHREDCGYTETRPRNIIGYPEDNLIIGLVEGATYNLNTALNFNAVGAAMANTQPINGDVRYVPSSWMVQNTPGVFRDNFSGAFSITQSGRYTLTVTFQEQVYTDGWQNTDIYDSKAVNIIVGSVVSAVPADGSENAIRINPQTGDDTPILPLVGLLAVALLVIIGVVIYRKKKK